MPLSATESMTGWALLKSSAALALSPALTAFCTFLMTVRNFERRAVLAAFSFTSWRTRLRPDAMRTVFFLALEEVAVRGFRFQRVQGLAKTSSIAFVLRRLQTASRNVSRCFL